MKKIVFWSLFLGLFLASCGNKTANEDLVDNPDSTNTPKIEYKENLPVYPVEKIQELINRSNQLDLVFLNKPVSMNVENDGAKQQAYSISGEGVRRPKSCEEMAYLFFKEDGVQILQVGVVFNDICRYYHIYEDGNIKYANSMRPEGFGFFQNILNQVQTMPGQ